MKKPMGWVLLLAALGVAFGAGIWKGGRAVGKSGAGRKALYWVDPMNPSFRSPEPGTAPCGMPLEPVYEDGASPGEASLSAGAVRVSPERLQLIGVRMAVAGRSPTTRTMRLLGRVAPDETRVYRVTGATDGWAKTVAPFTTGSTVRKGDLLATVYLPVDVVPLVQNYFARLGGASRVPTGKEPMEQVRLGQWNVAALRNNLRSQGLMERQLDEITRTRVIPEEIEVRAPVSGIVLTRNVAPEQRFDKGDELFRIADLGKVWVLADVFGSEAQAVRPGAAVTVTLPDQGQTFAGRASHVAPQFDAATRTLKVRIEINNPEYILRPDMFVDVELPVEPGPGLFIPKEAVLDSGLQRVVFVEQGAGMFASRKVMTGRRLGDQVEILSGLMEGETIVTSGNFLLDSESRMRAAGAVASATTAIDPICGMSVDETKARTAGLVSEHESTTYFFCAPGCKQKFDAQRRAAPENSPRPPTRDMPSKDIKPAKPVTPVVSIAPPMSAMTTTDVEPHEPAASDTPAMPDMPAAPVAPEKTTPAAGTGSQAAITAIDPICGMEVNIETARAAGLVSEHAGTTWYFCAAGCKKRFDADPTVYLPSDR